MVVLFLLFCICGVVGWMFDAPRVLSSNDISSVSVNGRDEADCGSEVQPCRTVAKGCAQGSEVVVGDGSFVETVGVNVVGMVSITGSDPASCNLLKEDNTSFTLFTLTGSSANLTLVGMTLLLTDDVGDFYFAYAPFTGHIVMIYKCRVTAKIGNGGDVSFNNGPSFLLNGKATLEVISCTIYNITTENTFIKMSGENVTLGIENSSFVNVLSNNEGGCFYLEGALNISLSRSVFVKCKSSVRGGVGYVQFLQGKSSVIQSCTFLHNSATGDGGGELYMENNEQLLTIINSSHTFCTANSGYGGAFHLRKQTYVSLIDCSFTSCSGVDGGAIYMIEFCGVNISGCTFMHCTASRWGGVIYASGSFVANITDSVYAGNMAVTKGNDGFFTGPGEMNFERAYTDKQSASDSMECGGACSASLLYKADYDKATCNDNFSIKSQKKSCQMPCALSSKSDMTMETDTGIDNETGANTDNDTDNVTGLCVKPDNCPTDFSALTNMCVHTCLFLLPSTVDGSCTAPCILDFSPGYPLCTVENCATRVPNIVNAAVRFPCGSSDCFQQIPNGGVGSGSLKTTCGTSCDAAHFTASTDMGVCQLKTCGERAVVSTLEFPCGSADCFQKTDRDGKNTTECSDNPNDGDNKSKNLRNSIIIAVVVPLVVLVSIGSVIVVVLRIKGKRKNFGEYIIITPIGKGTSGEVYKVQKGGNYFAIKRIKKKYLKMIAAEREMRQIYHERQINSPFIVKYYDVFDEKGDLCLVLELCPQSDLRKLVEKISSSDKDASLNQTRIIKITIQLLLGLYELHKSNIIHRDIKLENVFVDELDRIKIGDMGGAKVVVGFGYQVAEKCGSLCYRSPELVTEKPYSYSTDLWSLGVVIYELCTFKLPFKRDMDTTYDKIEYDPIDSLRAPEELRKIVDSLLNQDPEKRPSAYDLLQNAFIQKYAAEMDLLKYFPGPQTQAPMAQTIATEDVISGPEEEGEGVGGKQ